MEKQNFSLVTGTCNKENLQQIIKEFNEGYFLLEQPKRYLAGTIDDLPSDIWDSLISLTIFNHDKELKIEPDFDEFAYRLIEDNKGQIVAYIRDSKYLLRKHKVVEKFLALEKNTIVNREYFIEDDSGMPVLKTQRLYDFVNKSN